MKHVLVLSYSQSGQLTEILDPFLAPFASADVTVERLAIAPARAYPFPWTSDAFFDLMPETVLEEPIALAPFTPARASYDLIVLGYQPWFLSPSRPTAALLRHASLRPLLAGTPVVTVIGSRNMWINAQASVRAALSEAGARLVANIPFVDRAQNQLSAISILHWMLTGRKERKWGIFPRPGVSEADIARASVYGEPVAAALRRGDFDGLQTDVRALGGISIPTDILFIESRAGRLFRIWANLIKKRGTTPGRRRFWVGFFKVYLLVALFGVAPILVGVYSYAIAPFLRSSIARRKAELLAAG